MTAAAWLVSTQAQTPLTVGAGGSNWAAEGALSSQQPEPDAGRGLLLVHIDVENKGNQPVLLAEQGDLKLAAVGASSDKGGGSYTAKGICVEGSWVSGGVPKGIRMETKEGYWATWIEVDPTKPDTASCMFIETGAYRLTIEPGGRLQVRVLVDVPRASSGLELLVKGATPVKIAPPAR
jgi:hypothetical protein